MKFVFTSFTYTKEFNEPVRWLERISGFTPILAAMAEENEVHSIQQINFEGLYHVEKVNYHFKRFHSLMLKFFPLSLNLYVKKLKPDVIIVQGLHCPLRVLQLRFIVGRKAKIILQHRAEKPYHGFKKIFQKITDKIVNAYLFGSKDLGLEWVKAGNLASYAKIFEVAGLSSTYYPIEKLVAKKYTGAIGNPIYFWAGRLNENKNPLTVVGGFLKFTEVNPTAQLYMAYQTGELLSALEKLLADHPNGKKVCLIGNISPAELLYWFNVADYLISGSYYEGGGTVICEAMSTGCIPIVTAIPSFKMLTNNGTCGFLYEPGNANELAEILTSTQQLDLIKEREKCLSFFKSHLSATAISNKIQRIFNEL